MIGVFICHCGLNIAGTVDIERLAEALRAIPGVALVADYRYMCSEPGQALLRQAIVEQCLDGVVVAACSPAMHERTFRGAAAEAGLNPYRLEIANIREQVAWPHQHAPERATEKAIATVASIVEKVRRDEPLVPMALPLTQRALVVGGGVAGLTAALDIAEAGYPVLLVERSPQLGGHVRALSGLYAGESADKSARSGSTLLQERIATVTQHPRIQVLTSAQVTGFEGYLGNFRAQVTQASAAGGEAVVTTAEVGAVVLATGFELYPGRRLPEYGGGGLPDVVDTLQFEALLAAGAVRRPSDGRTPRDIVWVQCAGSRDPEHHRPYCSKICCMAVAKQALAWRRRGDDHRAYVCYIDIRAQGRGYDEFVQQATEAGVIYLRGKAARVVPRGQRLEVWGADTLSGRAIRIEADLVVLALAAVPSDGSADLARLLHVATDESGFFSEAHPKLRPVETLTAGIYVAGAAQFPKDIPEAVAQGSAAAAQVVRLFAQPQLLAEERCAGCGRCVAACPYGARALHPWRALATVNPALCQSCGACAVACPNAATVVRNATIEQVLAMVEALE